jgi:hypothetical protein
MQPGSFFSIMNLCKINKGLAFRLTACFVFFSLHFLQVALGQAIDESIQWGNWLTWGDQHNGTYRNPVLPADYSDLDCIRVKDDYYAISSTFQFSPGVVILHSKDLVNWSVLGHAVNNLNQISTEMNWTKNEPIWYGDLGWCNPVSP